VTAHQLCEATLQKKNLNQGRTDEILSVKLRTNASSVVEGVCGALSDTLSSSYFSALKKHNGKQRRDQRNAKPTLLRDITLT